jgi:hypothetical protein
MTTQAGLQDLHAIVERGEVQSALIAATLPLLADSPRAAALIAQADRYAAVVTAIELHLANLEADLTAPRSS